MPQMPRMTPLPISPSFCCVRSLPAATLLAQERGPAGTVTLSRTDYDRLLDLASRQPRPPDWRAAARGADARRHPRARRRPAPSAPR